MCIFIYIFILKFLKFLNLYNLIFKRGLDYFFVFCKNVFRTWRSHMLYVIAVS